MGKVLKRMLATVLLLGLVITSPSVARAATETASSMDELAKIVRDHAVKRDSKFDVKYKGNESDLDDLLEPDSNFFYVMLSMLDDASTSDDADYIVGNLNWWSSDRDNLFVIGNTVQFNLKYFETLEQTRYVNEHVKKILSELGVSSMSNYDKVVAIHDYVCDLITYSATDKDYESVPYGAIKYRKALCNAYSLCMYKLLVEAGVPCKFIGGKAGTGRDADGHAWNIVALGDKWYNLDATWDDNDDEDSWHYSYFLKGSSDFDEEDPSQPHEMDAPYAKGAFAKAFPIAKTKFVKGMNDENVTVKIGDGSSQTVEPTEPTDPDDPIIEPDDTETYTFKDIVYSKDPSNGKFSIKKGKTDYLMLYISEDAGSLIEKVSSKVTSGKKNLKVNYCTFEEDSYGGLVMLKYKGKKKGKANIKITIKLTNGQSVSCTFKGKVK